jgi:outer membrane protein OmpA-like peptidoglycan-associated protein
MRCRAFALTIAGVLGAAGGCAPGRLAIFDTHAADPAAQSAKFIVFFDYRSATPSPDMREVIGEAVRVADDNDLSHLIVIAHADGVGSESYKKALSDKRAKAVKAVLIADGVPEDDIAAIGGNAGDGIANTGPGASDPQNRRAVIRLDK